MQNREVIQALTALNGGAENIGYEEENLWYTSDPQWAEMVKELKETVRNQDVRASILIATDEDVLWASGSRSRDVNGNTVSPLTTFEIGSITKMHTAAMVTQLMDEGKLSQNDKVVSFFPAYKKAGEMTVYDLLHMRSGIVDFANDADVFFDNDEALMEALDEGKITDGVLLEHLYKRDLRFAPGSRMEYCNTNYVLLAMIVEKITGKSYRENVGERIFTPLHMEHSSATTWGDVTSVPEHAGYMKELETARGAGDIHSTTVDLLKFDRAFFNVQIVSPIGKGIMLDFVDGYGCGWEASARYDDLVTHGGETNGYYCLNFTFHASDAEKRRYFLMLTCCNEDDDDEDEEETAEAENAAAEDADEEEAFNQYQTIFDICKKYLQ